MWRSAEKHGCSRVPTGAVTARRSMYSLTLTAKLNDIDPQAWLADVLARIADMPQAQLDELLPWNWQPTGTTPALARAA